MLMKLLRPRSLYSASRTLGGSLVKNRELLALYVRRDLFESYAGQILGGAWMFLHPMIIISVYVLIFTTVFKIRFSNQIDLPLDYTAYMLSGLAPWLAFQAALSRSVPSLTAVPNLVKQVVFPIEVLPAKSALATLLPLVATVSIVTLYVLISHGYLPWTYLLLPVVFLLQGLWVTGLAFVFASLSVFVRDVREVVQVMTFVGVFVLPVMYLPQWLPPVMQPMLYLNPISHLIWCWQDVLYFGTIAHPDSWIIATGLGILIFALGSRAFLGLRPYFADAI